jgi:HEAT repeat protein
MWKNAAIITAFGVLGATALWQANAIRELRNGTTAPPPPGGVSPGSSPASPESSPTRPSLRPEKGPRTAVAVNTGLDERVATLEQQVAQLTQASEYLMARGQLPLAAHKIAELEQKVMDPNASDRDRLQALRLLRRNGAMSDAVVQQTLAWIQSATNGGLREDLVEQLGGTTNAAVREPMIKLATTDPNPDVREEAVQALRRFGSDPQVEALLWDLAHKDTDGGVREQAEEALREMPMNDARRTAMRARAMDANSSLDERLLAVRTLMEGGDAVPEVTAALAQFAQTAQDPRDRARVFGAFDGTTDPNMKLPLVYGLQDPNPQVRERAADALSGYKGDPAIIEWLKYVAENDAEPRVRREAQQALRDRR